MNKKTVLWIIIGFIIVGGLAFYAGLKYRSKVSVSSDQVGQSQSMNGGRRGGGMRGGTNVGFVGGSIVSIDATSMTVAMRDSSSKIVLFSTATPVMKMVAGVQSDLVVGKEVTINGTANPDGSVVADTISLRPTQTPTQKTN